MSPWPRRPRRCPRGRQLREGTFGSAGAPLGAPRFPHRGSRRCGGLRECPVGPFLHRPRGIFCSPVRRGAFPTPSIPSRAPFSSGMELPVALPGRRSTAGRMPSSGIPQSWIHPSSGLREVLRTAGGSVCLSVLPCPSFLCPPFLPCPSSSSPPPPPSSEAPRTPLQGPRRFPLFGGGRPRAGGAVGDITVTSQ